MTNNKTFTVTDVLNTELTTQPAFDINSYLNEELRTEPGEGTFQCTLDSITANNYGLVIKCTDENSKVKYQIPVRENGYKDIFLNILSQLATQLGVSTIRELLDPKLAGKSFLVTGYTKAKDEKNYTNYSFRL